jgi:TolB-like protein/Tfp pilus assembly protein PilF
MRRHRTVALVAAFVLITAGLAYFLYFAPVGKAIDSIAVLPFVNASGDPNTEYLSDGISEALINSLTELQQLRVIARTTAFRYKGKEVDPQAIGRELNVRAVLMGRVRQVGDTRNIQVDLVDTQTGAQLWGQEYERRISDVLSVKQAIAREITEKLRLRLSGADQQRLAKRDTTNAEAYQLYLRGRFHWNKRNTTEMQKSIEFFQQAVTIDSNYALGYTGLADAYSQLSEFQVSTPRELMPKAKEAASKAISIDDQLSEAHAALGLILAVYDYDFAAAERELKRAIELNPNYGTAHHYYSRVLTAEGRHEEALAENRRALEIDQLSLPFNWIYGTHLLFARKYDEAIAQLKKTLELDAAFEPAREWLIIVYQAKGDYAQCIEEIAKYHQQNGSPEKAALAREIFARRGWQGYLRTALDKNPKLTAYLRTTSYAALGEKDKAFAELDKQFENRTHLSMFVKVDPRFDSLRDDPRYADLVRRMALNP